MAFIKKIYAKSPDPDLERIARKQEYGQAQLARLAHVNQLGEEVEEGLQLCSDQITTSSASATIPAPFLQKTGTQITYADGTVLQGWKFTGGMLLTGANVYSEAQGTITIPSPDGGVTDEEYFHTEEQAKFFCDWMNGDTTGVGGAFLWYYEEHTPEPISLYDAKVNMEFRNFTY